MVTQLAFNLVNVYMKLVNIYFHYGSQYQNASGSQSLHRVQKKNGTTLFLAVTLPNANRFSKFFTNRLGNKFHEKRQLNIPSHLNRFATLPCEMYVLKNCNYPKLREANFHARLCHLKQLLKNIYWMMLASFLFTGKKIFTVTTLKNMQNDRLYAHPSTKKKDVVTKRLRTQLAFSHW